VFLTFFLGRYLTLKHENSLQINFEDLQLLKPKDREKITEILEQRIGLEIHKIQLIKVDFQKQLAHLKVFYYSNINESFSGDAEEFRVIILIN
jgi:hypothetical protein